MLRKQKSDEALKIASPYFTTQNDDATITEDMAAEKSSELQIRLTYARPNSNMKSGKYSPAFSANLTYIIKNDYMKVTVDAVTSEIIGAARAAKTGRSFGIADSMLDYSSDKMDLAHDDMDYLGYEMLSKYTCQSSSANTVVKNFWKGTNNYGFYNSAHGSSTVLTNNKTGTSRFRVTSSDVRGTIWNFVFLDACSTATGTSWSSAFSITNSAPYRAFIGFYGSAYADDTYNFADYFWSEVGYSSISDCVAYGDTAPGVKDTYSIFRGDSDYYGWV